MDAPICALLGAMAAVLQKLDSVMASGNTLLEEEGVRNQLDLLVGGLNEINTTLVDILEAEDPPSIAKIWMKDVRELSFDLQDYFEQTIHSSPGGAGVDPNKAKTAGKRSGLLKIPLLRNRRLKKPSPSPLAAKIIEFSVRVQQACQARVRYGLDKLTLERRFVCYGPRLPSLQDSLIIDHDSLDDIEKCLATDDGNKQLKVISIVGPAGVGKTTLAKRLYNKHRGAFQFRAFVRVSPYPDMRRLLTSIFVQIQKQQPRDHWNANDLIDKIAQHLENKRYFIIIDDLWDASVWDIVYRAFPKVSGCSRVITTTQVEDVALACSSSLSNNKFKIGPLDEKHSAELFFSKVFGCEDDCPTEFKEISYEIIRQCGGLPLSTINTAGMLASEPGFLMEQWKHIQHSLCPRSMTNASELLVHLKESQLGPSAEQSISRDTMVNSPVEEIDLMEDLFKSPIEDTPFMSAEDETGLKEAQSKYPVKDSKVEFGRKQMDHWSNNETDLQYTSLRTDHTSERMKKVINLVYHYLPPHLKTCLLYLNMYPADYMIRKDDVVKQWVAEDFISSVEGQDREEVARTYFDELINRGMLQAVDTDCNGQVLSCTVHHMILDLIAYKSMEDNFITIVDYFQRSLGVLDMGRRLSVQFGGAKSADVPAGIRISEVRSLMFFGFIKCVPSIVQYRLRVLVFHVWADEGNMSFDLDRISELFLLRYLKIAGNIRVKLPEKMEQLRFLETLEVDARVNDVPLDIFLLKSLLHLRLPGGFVWPDEFGGMKSLLTLGYYDLTSNSEDNIENLGQLTSLQDLHLTCSTVTNENSLEKNIKFLASVLGKLSNLRSVSLLHAGSSHAYTPDVTGSDRPSLGVSFDGLSNVSPVPTFLQRLELSRRYCIFSSLPGWIKETNCLRVLNITIKELLRDDINVLRRLPALTALSLYILGAPLERIVFGNEGFSVLKYLKLVNTTTVPWLIFETGEMSNLRKLKLGFNAHRVDGHGSAPINIGHLTGAKEISVKICCTSVDDAETALSASVINNDPRNPRINVQLIDWKFYTGGGTNLSTKTEPDDVINNSDEYDVDAGEASMEDESDQAVITDSGPWKHSSRMPAQAPAPAPAKEVQKLSVVFQQTAKPTTVAPKPSAEHHSPRVALAPRQQQQQPSSPPPPHRAKPSRPPPWCHHRRRSTRRPPPTRSRKPNGCERFAKRIKKPAACPVSAPTTSSSSLPTDCCSARARVSSSPPLEEDPEYSYLRTVLERGGFMRSSPPHWRPGRGHSMASPVDPIVFHLLELELPADEARLGPLRHRWKRKLLFDLAQELLADLLLGLDASSTGLPLLGKVWKRVQSFPVVGDIDALVGADLECANVRRLARHPAVEEAAGDVAEEVADRVLDALLAECVAESVSLSCTALSHSSSSSSSRAAAR